ncbi:cysteine--tRNA ligase [Chitinasiproducens palmae]|uniref:Cysteine--tRNA ligase n=1 Tax=Chitinasiproducens palmae TaxID=1770053 RepID=A0A1H2PRV9_9BURK|nr:cysteine--tRNA ligase [Chitinasiproducens palmae]SDV49668.1 cysteinyl-tRNA synthetase [Chitinasiproducens palmae]
MKELRIYNSLAREKQVFTPITPGEVKLYVCGMTVYDYCHVGHARVMVAFDLVRRWLRTRGYRVTYVRNITDIDDKIIRRAVEQGITIKALTDRFIAAMHEDSTALGIEPPDVEPRATDYVPQMLGMIDTLAARGYAYAADDGDVNYAVRKFDGYGQLSGKSLDDLRAGERVATNDAKHDPLDFVLWKRAKADEPADSVWQSRWGAGRPGWHIECSAMSCALFGAHFDIHGGGQDLQFPHHENEIAQSEGASGERFVNYWMHNGYVQIDGEKMSKSLGNFFTIRDVLARYDGEVVRFFIARAHYRSPLNYSDAQLDDARAALSRLYTALDQTAPDDAPLDWSGEHASRFAAAMDDDFNTAQAISVLFELAGEVNRRREPAMAAQLRALGGCLGLLQRAPRAFLQQGGGQAQAIDVAEIETLVEARRAAKAGRDFAQADAIRQRLLDSGVVLEDGAKGVTTWRRA